MEKAKSILSGELKPFAELTAAGQYEDGIKILKSRVARLNNSADIELLFESALLLWQCFEIEEAQSLFQQIVSSDACRVEHLTLIAKRLFGISRFAEAASVMAKAVVCEPGNPGLFSQWSSCLERSNQLDAAINAASKALQLVPGHVDGIRMLAHIERRQGNYYAAIDQLQAHLNSFSNQENWKLNYELAACLDRIGDYDRAWSQLLTAKQFFSQSSQDCLHLSYAIRRRQGELVKSITDSDLRRWKNCLNEPTISIALLAGFPRSGTTLLEAIITSNHNSVVGTDETGVLTKQFTEPIVWKASDPFEALLEIRSLEADQINAGREAYVKFTSATIGEAINNRLIIEKDPLLTCDLAIPLRLFPEAKIIMPLRDPRDVIISYFFTMVPIGWSSSPAINIVEAAKFYHDVMRHWILLRSRLPWDWIEIRYENLVVDPQREMHRIANFLQLEFTDSMLEPASRESNKRVSTPSYDDVGKPINAQRVSRWQNYQSQLEPAMEILDGWTKELGYE